MPDNLHLQCSFIVLRKDQAMIGDYMLVALRSCLTCPTWTQLLLLNIHSLLLFVSSITYRSLSFNFLCNSFWFSLTWDYKGFHCSFYVLTDKGSDLGVREKLA